ncbi:DUF1569 domain-containing protein [Jannaschia pohangensis]|uniref:DUF1569 domain-containing protein n=1 Tax=Jannaschia pohangensis TaxID=390807 RepID=A0A1I3UGG0_9RHOB|nr:DUF1569 domain-containing protein [Jannaschia pohangensis]SFJ80946.1 Protein of unknown function [Jannaschia pohangensis]
MKRRTLLTSLAATGAAALGGGVYVSLPHDHPGLAMDRLLERLQGARIDAIETDSAWTVARTLNHLAQSVDFSMDGYPELRSGLFRHTVGPLAFNVFQTRGEMSHDTAEVIPGEVVDDGDAEQARTRLIGSLTRFASFDMPLRPHFAFGTLSKAEYAKAHVMHVQDHLTEFRIG